MSARLGGVWAAVLTPLDEWLQPDAPRACAYYASLLAGGCDGLNVLGTTGEAMSLGLGQRLQFMEAVARSGLPCERMMAGTGAASLGDTVRLTQWAHDVELAAALIMPPFFYRDAGDDGVLRFFDELLARLDAAQPKLLLYNFPRMSGITFHPGLVGRLLEAYPGAICGLKDSSNDRTLQRALIERHPGFAVFPGSEADLADSLAAGAAGCISGTVALWPELAREVADGRDAAAAARLRARRDALAGLPLIGAVRYLTARRFADEAWERTMPPLQALDEELRLRADAAIANP